MRDGAVGAGPRIRHHIKKLRLLAEGPGGVGRGVGVDLSESADTKASTTEGSKARCLRGLACS